MTATHTISSHAHPPTRPSQHFLVFLSLVSLWAWPVLGAEAGHPIAAPGNFALHPALEMSLFAAEPDVVDPVALCFDEDGRVYVVEMRDYPYGVGPERKPGGTVRLLEDRDGDGQADRSVLFAEGLSFPTSIAPWKGGVLVTAPPEIIFLKDTDGDGQADVREVLFTGFVRGVTDSNFNGLRWGLDNRVHASNGGNGGRVTPTRTPGPPVPLGELDFSFDPESGDLTTTYHTGGGFGLVFDDWGRSFVPHNINHLQQRILPVRYLSRFPGFPPVQATESISDHGEMARIFAISTPETRPNHPEQAGHFSAAGGLGFIGSPLYPGDLAGSVLVCDVVGNLVHRDVLRLHGPTFLASRAPEEQQREFFASRDNFCRPIGVELGPDAALYLLDMQRDVIEHPDYIPAKLRAKLDLRAGEDRGRIYRLTPKGAALSAPAKLSKASTADLVALLSDPNQWRRLTAQRLLVERQDPAAAPLLRALAGQGQTPLGRLHALWTLHGLRTLDETLTLNALADSHPGVRENALLLAENFLPGSPSLQDKIIALAEHENPRVRFQAALSIGQFVHPASAAALRKILLRDYAFRWSRLAVLSSLRPGQEFFFVALLTDSDQWAQLDDAKLKLVEEFAELIGARSSPENAEALANVLAVLADTRTEEQVRAVVLAGLDSGLARVARKPAPDAATRQALERLSRGASPALLAAAWRVSRALGLPENDAQRAALAEALRRAQDTARPIEARLQDIRLLSLGGFATVKPALFALLGSRHPSAIQSAAVGVLQQFNDVEIATTLIDRWPALAPTVRPAVINLWLQRRAYHEPLVRALEEGRLKFGELNLDLEQRRRLLRGSAPDLEARAAKLFGDEEYSNRKAVVDEWLAKLPPTGDAARGQAIFEQACAQCHLAAGLGHNVGPDLSDLSHRSVEDIASNILDPNMAINPGFISFTVETKDDEFATGLLHTDTADTVTLLQAQSLKVTIPRAQITRMESTGLSLMPEGLEAGLTPQDLRDLTAFLQQKK
ncbi:MAG: HEAT repeat domain-containing protein [Verrucomicrobia bacterium]|nr:HEAT repeat domain-containing protein [Verrucomicrobiota bacterium]